MKNIFKYGINSNVLKTIALIAMVIDHIGFYFEAFIPTGVYVVCRAIGRIAMPIFVYILVQGFFHTKDFNKYLLRISGLAVLTQILITLLMVINIKFNPAYTSAKQVYTSGNILFSFAMVLIVLKILHQDILVKKWGDNKNILLKAILIGSLMVLGIILPIDYGDQVIILSTLMYYIEKFRIKILIDKSKCNNSIKNILLNTISDEKIKMVYVALILLTLCTLTVYFNAYWTTLLAILPIALYNGQKGKTTLKYIYYILFPLQHILLYLVAMAIALT